MRRRRLYGPAVQCFKSCHHAFYSSRHTHRLPLSHHTQPSTRKHIQPYLVATSVRHLRCLLSRAIRESHQRQNQKEGLEWSLNPSGSDLAWYPVSWWGVVESLLLFFKVMKLYSCLLMIEIWSNQENWEEIRGLSIPRYHSRVKRRNDANERQERGGRTYRWQQMGEEKWYLSLHTPTPPSLPIPLSTVMSVFSDTSSVVSFCGLTCISVLGWQRGD